MKRFLIRTLLEVGIIIIAFIPSTQAQEQKTAIFAGGCFWCVESDFDKVPGVLYTISGYTGGAIKNPSYKQVSLGVTGHYEALKVIYNPSVVNYDQLLTKFWHSIDPFNAKGQFCDGGPQYRAAIFFSDDIEREKAEKSKVKIEALFEKKIVTEILAAKEFYKAEEKHQNYKYKNPVSYKYYRWSCGRDRRIKEIWNSKIEK